MTTAHPGAGPYDYRVVEVLRVVDRWLADVYDLDGASLNDALLDSGHARPYTR